MGDVVNIDFRPAASRTAMQVAAESARADQLQSVRDRLDRERLSPEDRLRMARNLGEMAVIAAAGLGIAPKAFVRRVFDAWDRGDRWDKRKRWVLLPDDEQTEKPALSGADFYALATRLRNLEDGGQASANRLVDASLRLFANTTLDPDPLRATRAALDAQSEVRGILDGIRQCVLEQCPQLSWYFSEVSAHQIVATREDKQDIEFYPLDTSSVWTGGLIPEHLRDGTHLNEEWSGVPTLFPQVRLGTLQRWVRVRSANCPEPPDQSRVEQLLSDDNALGRDLALAVNVDLVVVPSGGTNPEHLHLGLRFHTGHFHDVWGREPDRYLPEIWFANTESVEAQIYDLPAYDPAINDMELICDTLQLVSGHQAVRIMSAAIGSPEYFVNDTGAALTFECAFEAPVGVTPVPAASLAGLLVRNAVFSARNKSITSMLAADAVEKVSALRRWLGDAHEYYRHRKAQMVVFERDGEDQ